MTRSKCRSISSWIPPTTRARQRQVGETTVEVHDIPYGDRNIWGATAGMLMTFRHLLQSYAERAR